MKAIYWDEATQGMKYELRDIPAGLVDEAKNGARRWSKPRRKPTTT
jgi:hypothetical protein